MNRPINIKDNDVSITPAQRLKELLNNEITISYLSQFEFEKWNKNRVSPRTIYRILAGNDGYFPTSSVRGKLIKALGEDIFADTSKENKLSLNSFISSHERCMKCNEEGGGYQLFISRHIRKSYGAVNSSQDKNFNVSIVLCSTCHNKNKNILEMGYSDLCIKVLKSNSISDLVKHLGVHQSTLNRIVNNKDEIRFIRGDVALELHLIAMNISKFGYYGDYEFLTDVYLGKVKLEELDLFDLMENEIKIKELLDNYLGELEFYGVSTSELEYLTQKMGWWIETEIISNVDHIEWVKDSLGDEISVYARVSYSYELRRGYPSFETEDGINGEIDILGVISERYGNLEWEVIED